MATFVAQHTVKRHLQERDDLLSLLLDKRCLLLLIIHCVAFDEEVIFANLARCSLELALDITTLLPCLPKYRTERRGPSRVDIGCTKALCRTGFDPTSDRTQTIIHQKAKGAVPWRVRGLGQTPSHHGKHHPRSGGCTTLAEQLSCGASSAIADDRTLKRTLAARSQQGYEPKDRRRT